MNSIISPWVFYWISVSDALSQMMPIGVFIGLGVLIFSYCYNDNDKSIWGEREHMVRKVGIFLTSLCLIGIVFLPSEDTCYKMLAADMFTQDNINNATEYVTDVIDYAVDKVKELSPTTENERS